MGIIDDHMGKASRHVLLSVVVPAYNESEGLVGVGEFRLQSEGALRGSGILPICTTIWQIRRCVVTCCGFREPRGRGTSSYSTTLSPRASCARIPTFRRWPG